MLVHIVHPYTYKLLGEKLIIGPINEYSKRDKKINRLVNTALDTGARVVKYSCFEIVKSHVDSIAKFMIGESALYMDPLFEILFDDKITQVMTTRMGVPIPNRKPNDIHEKLWAYFKRVYTSHSVLSKFVEGHSTSLFIGGALEACLANASDYHQKHFNQGESAVHYVKELCPVFELVDVYHVEQRLRERNILPIGYDKALELLVDN